MEGSLPFSHLAEVPGIDKACRCSLDAGIEQLSTTMADSEEIEVKAAISLKLFVVKENSQRCISAVEEAAVDEKKLASLPGIVGYLVQPGDTLWDIAREYYTDSGTADAAKPAGDREPSAGGLSAGGKNSGAGGKIKGRSGQKKAGILP